MVMERSANEGICKPYRIRDLFYYRSCGVWPVTIDSYTVSLAKFNTDLTDLCGKSWTANGGAAVSNSQYKFGTASLRLDSASVQYITTPNSTDFDFGSSTNFTIDFWVYLVTQTSYNALFSTATSGTGAYVVWMGGLGGNTSGEICFGTDGANVTWASKTGCTTSAWHHIAIVRKDTSSSGLGVAVDGVFSWGSGNRTINSHGSGAAWGKFYITGNNYCPNCYLDEIRISKGIARWTENFTPPTSEY